MGTCVGAAPGATVTLRWRRKARPQLCRCAAQSDTRRWAYRHLVKSSTGFDILPAPPTMLSPMARLPESHENISTRSWILQTGYENVTTSNHARASWLVNRVSASPFSDMISESRHLRRQEGQNVRESKGPTRIGGELGLARDPTCWRFSFPISLALHIPPAKVYIAAPRQRAGHKPLEAGACSQASWQRAVDALSIVTTSSKKPSPTRQG